MTSYSGAGAIFSEDKAYRYVLWRIWNEKIPFVSFIGLNPSTADENNDDPTLRRCIRYARDWGWGGLYLTNLFAFRTSYPGKLKLAGDPVGVDNDQWLCAVANSAALVIASWGNHGSHMQRAQVVIPMIKNLYYLHITKQGQPAHPLYLRNNLTPKPLSLSVPHPR